MSRNPVDEQARVIACIQSLSLSPSQEERELGTVARRGLEQAWKGWSEKLRKPEALGARSVFI